MNSPWQLWIDTGGTFTDCIGLSPNGQVIRAKVLSSGCLRGSIVRQLAPGKFLINQKWGVNAPIFEGYTFRGLSSNPQTAIVTALDLEANTLELDTTIHLNPKTSFEITANEEAPILATRLVTQTPLNTSTPKLNMRLGTTKGTNALLERKGARIAFLVTKGFADLLPIGTQQRPNLFQLAIPPYLPLYQQVFEVEERLAADGSVLQPLSTTTIDTLIAKLKAAKVEAVAVALLHAYRNPVHEQALAEALDAAGISFISTSAALSPAIKLLPRAQTAVVNAYLSPIIHQYLQRIQNEIPKQQHSASLRVMTSVGSLVQAPLFHPKDSLLSGPAGGVVGAATIGQQLGFGRILTLDMGGTSTDTARYNGQYDYQSITQIEQVEMSSPALAIETVAAGGGSICSFQQGRLQVGPASAGAQPGPACYDAGGPLTITDVNLLLSKLDPSGLGIPVRVEAAQAALQQVQLLLSQKTGTSYTDTELLQGFEQIANEKMAEAIRRISVAKGFDPKEYALLVFGGAGGLHACKIAELLGIDSILLPYDAGILSAYGMGQARIERFAERQILQLLHEIAPYIEHIIEKLHQQAMHELQKENLAKAEIERTAVQLFVRFKGQESTLEITFTEVEQIAAQFQAQYTQLFGHYPSKQQLELERIRVVLASKAPKNSPIPHSATTHYPKPHSTLSRAVDQQAIAIFDWDELTAGATIKGPAILRNAHATCYIEPNWAFEVRGKAKHMIGKWSRNVADQGRNQKEAIELELFTNRFGAIALEMGAQLQRTAFSVNIKERLDFSCAILDAQAELLVNAPHIPVHLGSLGICARLVLEHSPLQPGDVLLTNHPKYGGSHLPDLTMLCGVFTQNGECIGYVINRAHHAEIGGKRPGSMPPDATSLEEEGVSFTPTYLVKAGVVQWEAIRRMLAEAAFPSRMIEENIADLNAALASLRNGAHALQQLVAEHSLEKVQHYMQALKRSAQLALEQALPNYLNRQFEAIEYLDDGHRLQVQISVSEQELLFDFTGTSSRHPYNLNANISIVYSAILYVLRLLCKRAIPLNEGLMQKVRVQLPENSFLHPTFVDDAAACPAVVGGNTEVSQRLVDTLLKAFGLAACSQGTMNNFLFGNTDFGYYETIGGGVGAGPGFEGHSAVHQHMTNTRITDPEDLEFRYPVRLHRFGIRRDSGGEGQFRGGDGIVREVEFLEPMEMTMISQHRKEQPYGLAGGSPGKVGRQTLIRKNGTIEFLKGIDSQTLGAGDRVVIETPGGGGYGKKEEHGKNNT